MTILRNIRTHRRLAAAGLVIVALAAVVLTACEGGSYSVDIFPEQHYQQSFKAGEPPRLLPHPLAVPITGREILFDSATAPSVPNPVPNNADTMARAAEVFRVNCAMCHGQSGRGDGGVGDALVKYRYARPANLGAEAVQEKTDGELYWSITNGVLVMPQFKNLLSEEDRWTVIHYLRTFAQEGS